MTHARNVDKSTNGIKPGQPTIKENVDIAVDTSNQNQQLLQVLVDGQTRIEGKVEVQGNQIWKLTRQHAALKKKLHNLHPEDDA
jgi:hypothetical protein